MRQGLKPKAGAQDLCPQRELVAPQILPLPSASLPLSIVPQNRGTTAGSYRTHFPYKAAQVGPSSGGFHGLGEGVAQPWRGADQKAEFSIKL